MKNHLKKRALKQEIDINFTDKAVETIAKEGFDAVYGARPLRRAIQSKIEDALSEAMLDGSIKSGMKVTCSVDKNGKYTFTERVHKTK